MLASLDILTQLSNAKRCFNMTFSELCMHIGFVLFPFGNQPSNTQRQWELRQDVAVAHDQAVLVHMLVHATSTSMLT